ncbi:MAG: hypothetical protein J6Y07_04520 [Alphaproteobacteria bacterium]|nr:hypothetical protein [Alphaproteobacteria bacterium]
MEKYNPVSGDTLKIRRLIGSYNFAYLQNGGAVFIRHKARGTGKKHKEDVDVCVLKYGKALTFRINESFGYDNGTVFTVARVDSVPLKQNPNDSVGLYPYGIFDAKESDIMEHAARIFKKYDAENPNNLVKIEKIFRSYVPASYKKIKEQLGMTNEETKQNIKNADNKVQIMQFGKKFENF